MKGTDLFFFSFKLSLFQEVKEEFQEHYMEEEVCSDLDCSRNDEDPAENSVMCFVKTHIRVHKVLDYRIRSGEEQDNDKCSVFYSLDELFLLLIFL